VDVALVRDGRLDRVAGQSDLCTFFRSSAKPFQAMPLVDDGVVERFGVPAVELALCCASHSGEPAHISGVQSLLARIGASEHDLECGAHAPYNSVAAAALAASGQSPRPIHNNCSGKHAGMLALAKHHGWPTEGYTEAQHPVQRRMLDEVVRWTGVPEADIETATDGCGVVCFALTIEAMARAYSALAEAARAGEPAQRIVQAMTEHPFAVAGTDRVCTRFVEAARGRAIAKVGAEGVYGACVPELGLGIALKARDGAFRAAEAVLVRLMIALKILSQETSAQVFDGVVRDTRGHAVGRIDVEVVLEPAGAAV